MASRILCNISIPSIRQGYHTEREKRNVKKNGLKEKTKANLFRLLIDHYPIRKNIMKCNLQRFESLMMNILTLSLEPLIFNLKSE
jgi:hypothetical protein